MVIDFIIKTLDSIDHFFSVDDGITVRELKERVTEELGVPSSMQRLIFCGRVLQDEKRLSEYAVKDKVVHMVQRPPPGVENRQSSHRERDGGNSSGSSNSRSMPATPSRQDRSSAPNVVYWTSPNDGEMPAPSTTTARMQYFQRILKDIRSLIRIIARTELEVAERTSPFPRLDDMDSATTADDDSSFEGSPRHCHQNIVNEAGELEILPGHLGDMISELRFLETTFHRYRDAYVEILRDCDDESVHLSEEDIHHRQRQADISAELFHSFAHAYHLISDISLNIQRDGNSRLTSEPVRQHALPIYTQVNVAESLRTATGSNEDGQTSGGPSAEPNNTDGPPPELDNIVRGLNDIARIGNLEVVVSLEEVTPARLLGHLRDQIRPNTQQTSDPLNHIIDGSGNVQPLIGHQIFVAQMPFGAQPSDEVLQNLVSSVVRQNIIPGMEGGIHAQIINGMQNQATNRPQSQSEAPSQNASQEQAPNRQNESQDQNATQSGSQSQTSQIPSKTQERQSNPEPSGNDQQRPNPPRPRNANAWTHPQGLNCELHVYDKFLQCSSHHARRSLSRRSDDDSFPRSSVPDTSSAPAPQSKTNTLFELLDQTSAGPEYLAIAAVILMDEAADLPASSAVTSEGLLSIRERFEGYVYALMQRQGDTGLFEQHTEFINSLLALIPLRPDFDVMMSLKLAFYQYLDELTSTILSDSAYETTNETTNDTTNDIFLRCFRDFAIQVFSQVCGVISKCSPDGIEAVRVLHDAFLAHILQHVDEPLRTTITQLSVQTLNQVTDRITANRSSTHYLVRSSDGASTSMAGRGASTSMNYSSRLEVMSTTPPMTPSSGQSVTPTSGTTATTSASGTTRPARAQTGPTSATPVAGTTSSATGPVGAGTAPTPARTSATQRPTGPTQLPAGPTQPPTGPTQLSAGPTQPPTGPTQPPTGATQLQTGPTQLPTGPTSPGSGPTPDSATTSEPMQTSPSQATSSRNTQSGRRPAPSPRNLPYPRAYRRPWSPTTSDTPDIITVIVPPEDIGTHFGEEWVPTFTRDLRLQRIPAEPYSTAYMAGMPPHKRRCIRQGRPPHSFTAFFNDTIREATRLTALPPSRGFRMNFREHIRTLTELRAATSEDYDPQRFIATARFVNRQRDRDWVPPESKPE